MTDPLAPYQPFVQYVHAHVLRLGPYEHMVLVRLIKATSGWPWEDHRNSIASALARSPDELEHLQRAFDDHWPRLQPPLPEPRSPEQLSLWLTVSIKLGRRWYLIVAVSAVLLYLIAYNFVVRREAHRHKSKFEQTVCLPHKLAPQDPQIPSVHEPTSHRILGENLLIDERAYLPARVSALRLESLFVRSSISPELVRGEIAVRERPALVQLSFFVWVGVGTLSLFFATLGLALLRLKSYVRRQLKRKKNSSMPCK